MFCHDDVAIDIGKLFHLLPRTERLLEICLFFGVHIVVKFLDLSKAVNLATNDHLNVF